MYIVYTVKKDEYMEQYTQMIGKNVYTVNRETHSNRRWKENPRVDYFLFKIIYILNKGVN